MVKDKYRKQIIERLSKKINQKHMLYPSITYYWTVHLILDHSDLVGNLTNSKIAETKALEPLKS
jgi:hypothetical protein